MRISGGRPPRHISLKAVLDEVLAILTSPVRWPRVDAGRVGIRREMIMTRFVMHRLAAATLIAMTVCVSVVTMPAKAASYQRGGGYSYGGYRGGYAYGGYRGGYGYGRYGFFPGYGFRYGSPGFYPAFGARFVGFPFFTPFVFAPPVVVAPPVFLAPRVIVGAPVVVLR